LRTLLGGEWRVLCCGGNKSDSGECAHGETTQWIFPENGARTPLVASTIPS
jgi:hypothetical protein